MYNDNKYFYYTRRVFVKIKCSTFVKNVTVCSYKHNIIFTKKNNIIRRLVFVKKVTCL